LPSASGALHSLDQIHLQLKAASRNIGRPTRRRTKARTLSIMKPYLLSTTGHPGLLTTPLTAQDTMELRLLSTTPCPVPRSIALGAWSIMVAQAPNSRPHIIHGPQSTNTIAGAAPQCRPRPGPVQAVAGTATPTARCALMLLRRPPPAPHPSTRGPLTTGVLKNTKPATPNPAHGRP